MSAATHPIVDDPIESYRRGLHQRWTQIRGRLDAIFADARARGVPEAAARRGAIEAARPEVRALLAELLTRTPLTLLRTVGQHLRGWEEAGAGLLEHEATVRALIDAASLHPTWASPSIIDVEAACDDAHWGEWVKAWYAGVRGQDPQAAEALIVARGVPRLGRDAMVLLECGIWILDWLEGIIGATLEARDRRLGGDSPKMGGDRSRAGEGGRVALDQVVGTLLGTQREPPSPPMTVQGAPVTDLRDLLPDVVLARRGKARLIATHAGPSAAPPKPPRAPAGEGSPSVDEHARQAVGDLREALHTHQAKVDAQVRLAEERSAETQNLLRQIEARLAALAAPPPTATSSATPSATPSPQAPVPRGEPRPSPAPGPTSSMPTPQPSVPLSNHEPELAPPAAGGHDASSGPEQLFIDFTDHRPLGDPASFARAPAQCDPGDPDDPEDPAQIITIVADEVNRLFAADLQEHAAGTAPDEGDRHPAMELLSRIEVDHAQP